jgi:hypothetical protein
MLPHSQILNLPKKYLPMAHPSLFYIPVSDEEKSFIWSTPERADCTEKKTF